MRSAVWSIHPGLAGNSRVPTLAREGQSSYVTAMVVLLGAGVSAALATVFLDLSLRIPGHAILRSVFPMALGLSLAPRRMGGMVMGTTALSSVLLIKAGGWATPGVGALTSLALTGPFLDVALWQVRKGWRLYLAFATAGLTVNLAALTIRAGVKFGGFDHLTARPLAAWWFQAVGTYALCGIVAGLLSAMVWFRFSSDSPSATTSGAAS
ncbi:MAG: hypothetical protein HQ581_29255 [Planctomycetes bacterium]|nr:hypothetical protein [Planctomycetota bacterium]